jgi:hypothetical protein
LAHDAIEESLLGLFEFAGDQKRVAFKLGGQERWVIDTRRFSGSPKLKVERSDKSISLELTGAEYPGTNLPANLLCDLRSGKTGWRMKLNLELGSFRCEVPFEKWLAGQALARCKVTVNARICELGSHSGIKVSGDAKAEFFPNWVLRLTGSGISKLSALGPEVVSDSIEVSLLGPDDPSIISQPLSKRTLITLNRGDRPWPFDPVANPPSEWKLVSADNSFDVINVEVGESKTGLARQAFVAQSQGEESKLFVQPASNLTGSDGKPFVLPLRNARYAVAFDPAGDQTALVADFGKDPVWLQADGCNLLLGDSPGTPPFEMSGGSGKASKICCTPALLSTFVPLPGSIVEPTPAPEDSRVEFVSGATKRTMQPNIGRVHLSSGSQPRIFFQVPNLAVSVLRPEDLLSLRFEFINLRLQIRDGRSVLARDKVDKPAYIVVHFPPQSIAEEAFFEESTEFKAHLSLKHKDSLNQGRTITEDLQKELRGYGFFLNLDANIVVKDRGRAWQIKDDDQKYTIKKEGTKLIFHQEPEILGRPPIKSRISGPSQLVFEVPQGATAILYSLEQLLQYCLAFDQHVAPIAAPPLPRPGDERSIRQKVGEALRAAKAAKIQDPSQVQDQSREKYTFIEAPYRLVLSPNLFAGWAHSIEPVTHNGRTELWHTRLGVRALVGMSDRLEDNYYRTLRAIWSPDYTVEKPPDHQNNPFRMSLDARDRYEIVHLTSGFNLKSEDGKDYVPLPVEAEHLMLTPLGAWMNIRGAWEDLPKVPYDVPIEPFPGHVRLAVEEWRHRATMGRDHYVRVVYKGYLFPFGHRASLIKITERKFHADPVGNPAYLRQRMYIVVRQPEKVYRAKDLGIPNEGKKLPFTRVRITTLITPNLNQPIGILNDESAQSAFWPKVGGQDFLFNLVAEDRDGQLCEFSAPLIFVDNSVADKFGYMKEVAEVYDASGKATRQMHGQKVAFAESNKVGDTTLETEGIEFGAFVPSVPTEELDRVDQPRFYPFMKQAKVHIPAIAQLVGTGNLARIAYHQTYLNEGIASSGNKGQVFAQLVFSPGQSFPLDFRGKADKVGGLATPNISVTGLSRLLGPVGGDLKVIDSGSFNPQEFFGGALDAKILGGIALKDVLKTVGNFQNDLTKVPRFVTEQLPDEIRATFNWKTNQLQRDPAGIFVPRGGAELRIDATLSKKLPRPGAEAQTEQAIYDIRGRLTNFDMDFLGFVIVKFSALNFTAKSGQKLSVNPDISSVKFGEELEFVNELTKYLGSRLLGGGPHLDVSAEGVTAGYTLPVPSIGIGVFSLQNIKLAAELNLPFTGQPARLRFNFSTPDDHFDVSVAFFGGGGFFQMEVGLDGVKLLWGSLEFGGSFSLNLGVASGSVHALGGIEYKWGSGTLSFTFFFRAGGEMEVLGIISVSVEFYVGLGYEKVGNKEGSKAYLVGQADYIVEVDMFFFCVCVTLTIEKSFGGSSADPSFADLILPHHWNAYCQAFA